MKVVFGGPPALKFAIGIRREWSYMDFKLSFGRNVHSLFEIRVGLGLWS